MCKHVLQITYHNIHNLHFPKKSPTLTLMKDEPDCGLSSLNQPIPLSSDTALICISPHGVQWLPSNNPMYTKVSN